jgi:hypothetical protein
VIGDSGNHQCDGTQPPVLTIRRLASSRKWEAAYPYARMLVDRRRPRQHPLTLWEARVLRQSASSIPPWTVCLLLAAMANRYSRHCSSLSHPFHSVLMPSLPQVRSPSPQCLSSPQHLRVYLTRIAARGETEKGPSLFEPSMKSVCKHTPLNSQKTIQTQFLPLDLSQPCGHHTSSFLT